MRRSLATSLALLVLTSCASSDDVAVGPRPDTSSGSTSVPASPAPSPSGTRQARSASTSPDRATRLADRLVNVNSNFYDLLDVWLEEVDGKPRGAKFRTLEVLGLKKQVMMRKLVKHPELKRAVLRRLPPGLRLEAKRNVKAARELYKLTPPSKPGSVKMKTSKADPPKKLLKYYRIAQERFGVQWTVLAAVNLVESRMGRINGPSSSGALGPMQFMPATWDAYGKGDPFKPYNAIMAAGRYLSASGAPDRLRDALWNYNHSDYYVDGVLAYHRQMHGKPESYFSYYFWQVFVRTTKGDMQLTGPGSDYPY